MALAPNPLSLKAPPPRVVLLPDALFFVRVVAIAPAASAAEVASQVELALEGLSPFPVAHLFHGHHWVPGSTSAVVYAAYRKRFGSDETEAWSEAELVAPRFATLLTARVDRGTAAVLPSDEGLTVIHWGGPQGEPSTVLVRAWNEAATDGERLRIQEELVRSLGGTRVVHEIDQQPALVRDGGAAEFSVKAGPVEAALQREQLDALDVRDKAELAVRRRGHVRDVFLWRAFLACVAGIALAGLLEVGMIGGRFWQRSRQALVEQQAPQVAEIERAQSLATRIEELSTKRLRPLEMISIVAAKRPSSIYFSRATTTGLLSLEVEAQTSVPADVSTYQASLRQIGEIAKVDVQPQGIREGTSVFRLVVTFKPEAFAPAKS